MRNDKADSELKFSSIMKGFEDIQKIQLQMNHAHTTEAKKYALKKQAQFLKAKIIKERRRIKVAAEQTNNSNFKPTC